MWTRVLGGKTGVRKLGPKQWEAFQHKRASGELDARGRIVKDPEKRRPVGPRVVAKDLKVLRAACRRATIERTANGDFLLIADPTRGLSTTVEKNPRRPIVDHDRFEQILAVADSIKMQEGWGKNAVWVPSYLPILLRLAGDTGRRIGAILALRWSDWKPNMAAHGMIRWRAEEDKVGREWWAPVTPEVRNTLERFRLSRPGVGDALMFPAPGKPTVAVSRTVASGWLKQAEKEAGLDHLAGGSWHPFRRRWATERKHLSPTDVAAAGGWVDTTTLQKCYQSADLETMQAVLEQPRRLKRIAQ